ncbi:hypothetical protein [Gymnodinialimonas ceratoperidinii]|uniref:Uncharacterized protein n=1 Tax=Gymnodinialimonas ceratoperidinii TaxID=2856823 RepID=A0A8F6YCJ5_9RHOB|nr:hypothetical protein [Gymnodinialimonas ceratoperidinii]QXT39385.1 hypothetical protein KYE46_15880 [Gymnodinialimonas ceratoperidinii]
MSMRICFAAGDVGGARAILPVARLAAARGLRVVGLDHGVFRREGDDAWHWLSPAQTQHAAFDVLVYATSVADPLAFQTALGARQRGIPVVHVLDNWSQYAERLQGMDRNGIARTLIPDAYCVMDQLARDAAKAAGVPGAILRISGHPALASLAEERRRFRPPVQGLDHLLFVSEPVKADSGARSSPSGRGYDEAEVSNLVAAALAAVPVAGPMPVHVAPHPRECREAVADRWHRLARTHGLNVKIVAPDGVRDALHHARAVLGMSSLLLYEAWLLGKPTLSLQPNLRLRELRQLREREGLGLCTDPTKASTSVKALLATGAQSGAGRQDMALHAGAAAAVLACAQALCRQPAPAPMKEATP